MNREEQKIHNQKIERFQNVDIKDQLMTVELETTRKPKGNFMRRLKKENEIVKELTKNGIDLTDYLKNQK